MRGRMRIAKGWDYETASYYYVLQAKTLWWWEDVRSDKGRIIGDKKWAIEMSKHLEEIK